jgi:hypothetical protein
MLAHVDARVVQDRLDQVVGCGARPYDFVPLHLDKRAKAASAA